MNGTASWQAGLASGGLGLPLAFVALPLYVQLPAHYASQYGVPLGALGALLLAARAFDALLDPWLGRRIDARFADSAAAVWRLVGAAALLLGLGFVALFFPPEALRNAGPTALLAWCGAALLPTCLAYSLASIAQQSWCARLGGDAVRQAHLVAWREGCALAGVLLASLLPTLAGWHWTTAALAAGLLLGWLGLGRAPQPMPTPTRPTASATSHAATAADALSSPGPARSDHLPTHSPWREAGFRRLLLIFLLNGVASAVPATLVLFFVRDRLQAPAWEGAFLAGYFLAGALSLPLWVRLVARLGLARSWALGMVLAIVSFAGAGVLDAGDALAFGLICLASGVALGADLALPSALLAEVVRRAGRHGAAEGVYFGWWQAATKLNLALAAGLALPLLELGGYQPGSRDPAALQTLGLAYAVLPCVLKLLALGALWWLWLRAPPSPSTRQGS
ncbi:MAG: MFS transporter, partial [Leptothrix sp. (in: b-proteobacteria)]